MRFIRPIQVMRLFELFVVGSLLLLMASGFPRIEADGESYLLSYTNLDPGWTLETTTDFETWHSVIIAGEFAPREIALTLSNQARAQFYRIRTTEPTTP